MHTDFEKFEMTVKSTIIWDLTPYNLVKFTDTSENRTASIFGVEVRAEEARKRPARGILACMVYSLTLKMEAICFFEMSVNLYQTRWLYIPEVGTLHKNFDRET
jgi:hypothetical protein